MRVTKYSKITLISICAKLRPKQFRGPCANGENRSDSGLRLACKHPTDMISSSENVRNGLNLSTSSPHSSGFLCLDQVTMFTTVPRGSETLLPPLPITSSRVRSWRNVPFGTEFHRRKVSVMHLHESCTYTHRIQTFSVATSHLSMNGSWLSSVYVGSRSSSLPKKSSTSCCSSF